MRIDDDSSSSTQQEEVEGKKKSAASPKESSSSHHRRHNNSNHQPPPSWMLPTAATPPSAEVLELPRTSSQTSAAAAANQHSTPPSQLAEFIAKKVHKQKAINTTAGKALWSIIGLLVVTFIVALTILAVGESATRARRSSSGGGSGSVGGNNNNGVVRPQVRGATAAAEDDEANDAEIYNAVVTSMAAWEERRLKKSLQQQRLNDSRDLLSRQRRDEEIVCYGELGCFRDEGPFDYLDMLPSTPEEVNTKFLLYTRKNLHSPQIYSYFNFTTMSPFKNCHFNSSQGTKVIIHGFGSTCGQVWASEIRLSVLAMAETNIICVDWENGAALPNYVRAAVNTRLVGKQVALLILWLNKHFGSDTKDFHLIGFSLGAHVAGFAGQELKNLSRITGLDPAGPLFESYDPKVRLDSSDAIFVDVIHSNGDSLLMGGLGSWEPMGHVDFYPNGGRVQKGCSNLFLGAVRDFLWAASDGDGRSLCNHRRAYKFFTESVSPKCSFPAFTCDSYDKFLTGACFSWDSNRCGNMGYYADQMPVKPKGILYLLTREDEPFCANQYRITVESSPSPVPITTYGGLEAVIIGNDFINETFLITQTAKDSMIAGSVLQKLVVAHPAITEPIQIQLKYTAYQGWLYSGIARWSMDSLIITNAYGKSLSFCTRLLLPSGIPVTIRLTPGICLNRFSAAAAGGEGGGGSLGRPQLPPSMHPHEAYPTDSSNPNSVVVPSTLENSTQLHSGSSGSSSGSAIAHAADLELSLMKPPRVVITNQQPQHGSHEVIGPTYHTGSSMSAMDWSSQWHPVLEPSWAKRNRSNAAVTGGTPVVLYPPASEELDLGGVEPPAAVAAAAQGQESGGAAELTTETEPPMGSLDEDLVNTSQLPTIGNHLESFSVENTTEALLDGVILEAAEVSSRPQNATSTDSIQICHFVAAAGEDGGGSGKDGAGQMACIYPAAEEKKPATISPPPPPLGQNPEEEVMSNNALGQITSFQHIVEAEETEQQQLFEALKQNSEAAGGGGGTPPSSLTTRGTNSTGGHVQQQLAELPLRPHPNPNLPNNLTTSSIVENSTTQQIPPHLHFILQQLESEGLGPGGAVVSRSTGNNGNEYHAVNRVPGAGGGPLLLHKVPPPFFNSHHNSNRKFNFNQQHLRQHQQFQHQQQQQLLHHEHQDNLVPDISNQLQEHQLNPKSQKMKSPSNNNKTPIPSSRALKHRPVALASEIRRRSRVLDISTISLTPAAGPLEGYHHPIATAYGTRLRPIADNLMMGSSSTNSRRIYRGGRVGVGSGGGGGGGGPATAVGLATSSSNLHNIKLPPHPTLFYPGNNNHKQSQPLPQQQSYFLFANLPSPSASYRGEFHPPQSHPPHIPANNNNINIGGAPSPAGAPAAAAAAPPPLTHPHEQLSRPHPGKYTLISSSSGSSSNSNNYKEEQQQQQLVRQIRPSYLTRVV